MKLLDLAFSAAAFCFEIFNESFVSVTIEFRIFPEPLDVLIMLVLKISKSIWNI